MCNFHKNTYSSLNSLLFCQQYLVYSVAFLSILINFVLKLLLLPKHIMSDESVKDRRFISNEIIASTLQFVNTGGSAAWLRYQQMYFLENNLTVKQIGVIAPFTTIMKFIGTPFWSYLIDISNNFRFVYTASAILSFILLSLYFIKFSKDVIFDEHYFVFFGIIRCLRSFTYVSWVLTDIITIQLIKDKNTYGQHRLFASVSWGICSLIIGYIIDYFGYNSILIYEFIGFILMLLLVNIFVPNQTNINDVKSRDDIESNKDYYTILKERIIGIKNDTNFMICMVLTFIYFMGLSIIDGITYIQFKDIFNVHDSYIGRFVFVSTLSEIPCFYFGKQILNKFNPNTVLLFSHIVLCIRLFLYSLIDKDHLNYVYLLELLHGFCIALPTVAVRIYFHKKAIAYSSINVNLSSSIQSILGIIGTIAWDLGVFLWSYIYSDFSVKYVYYIGSIMLIPSIILISICRANMTSLFNDHSYAKQVRSPLILDSKTEQQRLIELGKV